MIMESSCMSDKSTEPKAYALSVLTHYSAHCGLEARPYWWLFKSSVHRVEPLGHLRCRINYVQLVESFDCSITCVHGFCDIIISLRHSLCIRITRHWICSCFVLHVLAHLAVHTRRWTKTRSGCWLTGLVPAVSLTWAAWVLKQASICMADTALKWSKWFTGILCRRSLHSGCQRQSRAKCSTQGPHGTRGIFKREWRQTASILHQGGEGKTLWPLGRYS